MSVLRSEWLTQGPTVERFEDALAAYCGARHAVAVSSGTAALHLACLSAGIGDGDEVITTPNTFVASANCASYCGADVVLADIDMDTHNLDPQRVEEAVGPATKAIIPVHFGGHPCEMDAIARIARERGLMVIEDGAHALGAEYAGSKVGSCTHSDMTVFSFHPVKAIATAEGGAVLTNDDGLADRLRMLRSHGLIRDPARFTTAEADGAGAWYCELQALGFNYRLTDIQCALGLSQLGKLEGFLARRRLLVERYRELLSGMRVQLPVERPGVRSAWHIFPVLIDSPAERLRVFQGMRAASIGVQVHYVPVHLHPLYRDRVRCCPADLPVAGDYYSRTLTLPLYPALTEQQQDRVVERLSTLLAEVSP